MADVITKCPACGGDLIRKRYMKDNQEKEFIGCSNWKEKECKYSVFPTFMDAKLTDAQIKELVETGRLSKPVSVKVKLKYEDNRIKMDFSK